MCGIVYSKSLSDKPVSKTIRRRFLAQRHRGTNGFGFYAPQSNRLTHNVKEGRILSLLKRSNEREILFHHRFPTSTDNVRKACHPFSTKNVFESNYVLVHNGVVRNTKELKEQHDKLGIQYVSLQEDGRFNDSEALTYDIARYLEGQVTTLTAAGSIAFICTKRDADGKPVALFFGRNTGNPLKMKHTKHSLTISSEGEGDDVEPNKLHCYVYETGELTSCYLNIPLSSWTTYGGNYNRTTYTGQYAGNRSTVYDNGDYDKREYDWQSGSTVTPRSYEPVSEEETEEDYEIADKQIIKDQAEYYLYEANYDFRQARLDVSREMMKVGDAIEAIDTKLSLPGDDPGAATAEDLEAYDGLEEKLDLLRHCIAWLNFEEARNKGKEVPGKQPAGFLPPATLPTTTIPATPSSPRKKAVKPKGDSK